MSLDYPILSDPTRAVAKAYGLVTSDTANAPRWTVYIGKDGKILHIDKAVKAASHGQDVAGKLAELGVAKSGS